MPVFLVVYELNNPDQDYSTFEGMLRSYPNIRLTKNVVMLQSNEMSHDFFDGIWPFVDQHDPVEVMTVGEDWCVSSNPEVKQWLKDHH